MNLLFQALIYNMDAHRSNPVNLWAGALGMMINNILFLIGIWGMIFAGKPQNSDLLFYYLALNATVMVAWGAMNFFFGGLKSLGELITEGALEPMLATPRDPLLLAGISKSHPIALGDFLMGIIGFVVLAFRWSSFLVLKCAIASVLSAIGFMALFIFAGALSFFIPRGSAIGQLLIEITVSLSVYPTGKMFVGLGRIFLLLTPAAATAVLPLEAVESAGFTGFLGALGAALAFLYFSIGFFRQGLRRYRAVSIIGVN